jgi:tetratricopeptide (TPR) repeat protein
MTFSIFQRSICVFIFLLNFTHNQLIAQDPVPISTPAIVSDPEAPPTSGINDIEGTTDEERVKTIYDKLVKARGDYRFQIPEVFLRNEVARAASIDYENLEIVLEKKAYDACLPYGDAAIAFLLGHELTHYYEKHAWRSGFAGNNNDLKASRSLKVDNNDMVSNEIEADYLGGFLAYSAGFGLFDKGGEIIKSIYKDYKMKDDIDGYPSLQDRVEFSKRSASKLESLIDAFEMANMLNATGKFEEAKYYYKYILMHYQSREIYNNVGAANLYEALSYFDQKDLKFKYPVQLDLKTQGARDVTVKEKRESLLREAIKHFNYAIGLDAEYAPAYLNKAIALTILGDYERALFLCNNEALELANKQKLTKLSADAKILKAIIYAKTKKETEAKKILNDLVTKSKSKLAKINLDIITTGIIPKDITGTPLNEVYDTIQNFNLKSIAKNRSPNFDTEKVLQINNSNIFFQWTEDTLNFKIYFNQISEPKFRNFILLTKPGSTIKNSKKIGLGSPGSLVTETYGPAKQTLETPLGSILIYNNSIFILNEEDVVERWGNFSYNNKYF